MTREEFRNYVEFLRSQNEISYDVYSGLIDGIDTLEQEPCDDAVSRQAVIDAMYALCDTGETLKENPWRDNPYIDAITDALNNLPSVNPQRTGHWIQTQEKDDAEPFILWECSECHKEFRSVVHKVSNYCPSCGCRIVEP